MEFISKLRWVLAVFILLFILVLVGWGLSTIARNIFGDTNSDIAVETVENEDLSGVVEASYTVNGPVVATSENRSYTITVTEKVVSMQVFSDFGRKVIRQKSYDNNSDAFTNFIKSLENSNATARFAGTDENDDFADQGVCPTGYTYILELDSSIRRWTTSCDRNQGTAAGKMTTMRSLFQKQVPDFAELLEGTGISTQ